MQKNNRYINIAFSLDDKYIMILCVALCSLTKQCNSDYIYRIHILSNGLSLSSKSAIKECVKDNDKIIIIFLDVKDCFKNVDLYVKSGTADYLSIATYYRLCLHNVLQKEEKVLYVDSDVVFCKDPSELYDIVLGDNIVAGVPDIAGNWRCYTKDSTLYEYRKSIGIKDLDSYINAGVVLLNLKELRRLYPQNELIAFASSKKWEKHDQDVINVISEGKKILLPYSWNMIEFVDEEDKKHTNCQELKKYIDSYSDVGIIHYATRKPWISDKAAFSRQFWYYAGKCPYYYELIRDYCYENVCSQDRIIEVMYEMASKGQLSNKKLIRMIIVNIYHRIKK